MVKKIILTVIAVMGLGLAWVSTQTSVKPYHNVSTLTQITTDAQRREFNTKMLKTLQSASAKVTAEYKKGNFSSSNPYAKVFEQNVLSPTSDKFATFSPTIVKGGLSEDGSSFNMIVDNGSSRDDLKSQYLVSGTLTANGDIKAVEVTKL
jgi:hypothetical protein